MPAIKKHRTETDDGAWDGAANEARLRSGEERAYYERVYAWRDSDADETTKSAYKFPHHVVGEDGEPGAANIKACQSGIGALNGGRGGADIAEGDRQGVYNHLAAHLEDGGVEPPALRNEDGRRRQQEVERRTFEMRVSVDGGDDNANAPQIVGYAAVFDQLSEPIWGFREKIARGAFSETILADDIRALWNHDSNYVLGRNRAGTLRLHEDENGLAITIDPPDAQWARDLAASIRRGDVNQMSFGFSVPEGGDEYETVEGEVVRTLRRVKLYDVSPVTFPAYPQTTANVRSMVEKLQRDTNGVSQEADAGSGGDQAQARLENQRRRVEIAEREYPINSKTEG